MAGTGGLAQPLRTRKLLADADRLERAEFYQPATALYVEYLGHVMWMATLRYYETHYPERTETVRRESIRLNDRKKSTLSGIRGMCPNKLWNAESNRLYKEIETIRNTVTAHPYFAISLRRTRSGDKRLSDIGHHRKVIRRLYRIVRDDQRMARVDSFLARYPLIGYRSHEEESLAVEQSIMRAICRKARRGVLSIERSLDRVAGLLDPSVRTMDVWLWDSAGRPLGPGG